MGSPYANMTTEQMINIFVHEFSKIKRCSSKKYNRYRSSGSPTWECLARRFGVTTWEDVCDIAGVRSIRSMTNTLPLDVYSFTDTEIRLMEIELKYAKILGKRN